MRFMGRSSNKQATTSRRNGRSVRISDMLIGIASVVVILLVWQIAATQGWISPYHFPPPSKLAASLTTLTTTGFPKGVTVFSHIGATVWRILKGYTLATILAIPIGLLIGQSPGLDRAANPIITFARSVATISLLPLAVAWFGVGELSRVLLITYGCFWIILTNVVHGVKNVDPTLMLAAETLGASRRQIFFRVVLPASLPRIFSGMKVALGLAFLVIVAVEMIGTIEGLGALIMEARTFYRTGIMMVGMLIIAMFGFVLTKGLDWLEQYLLPWSVGLEEIER